MQVLNNFRYFFKLGNDEIILPKSFIKRLQFFETEKQEAVRNIFHKKLLEEHASAKLNEKVIIPFPKMLSQYFDPFLGTFNLQRLAHHIIASCVLVASLQTEKLRLNHDQIRAESAELLLDHDFTTIRLTLQDGNGIKYDSILSGKIDHIIRGNFVFRLGGNNEAYEMTHVNEAWDNHFEGFATFQMNGPRVGRSQGQPSYATIVNSAKIGLQFLETLVSHYRDRREKLKGRVVIKAFSLGNGIISEVLKWHTLDTEKADYLVCSQNTFSRLSAVPAGFFSQHMRFPLIRYVAEKICTLGNLLFTWAKFDFDSVQAARLLSQWQIPHAILQACVFDGQTFVAVDDGVVSKKAALLTPIIKADDMCKKLFAPNVLFDKSKLVDSFFKSTEFTHCTDNSKWFQFLLNNFDEMVLWAKQPSSNKILFNATDVVDKIVK